MNSVSDRGKAQGAAGHQASVWFVTFDATGELIASASQDGTIKLWSRDGLLLQSIEGHSAPVYGIDISSDQQLIATAGTDGTAKLWHRDGSLHATLLGHNGPVLVGSL